MKKSFLLFRETTIYKLGVLPILMTFLFVAGMQVDMNAQAPRTDGSVMPAGANSSPRSLYNLPSGNFVTAAVAQERLALAMKTLKDQLTQYPEGSAQYNAALLRYKYYNSINENLVAGKGVAQSIIDGIPAVSMTSSATSAVSQDTLFAEKNTVIALLRP